MTFNPRQWSQTQLSRATFGLVCLGVLTLASVRVFADDPAAGAASGVTPESSPSPEPSPSASSTSSPSSDDPLKELKNAPKDTITELILDASGSMKEKVQGRTKLLQAKRVMRSFMIESQNDKMELGFRVYGLKEKDCKSNSTLLKKFGDTSPDAIDAAMEEVDPKGYGKTPLASSLEDAAKDLKKYPDKPRRIIVVTDGVETCGGDPCAIAKKLKKEMDIKIFVVGYTLNEKDRRQLACLSDETNGAYQDATDLGSLTQAMKNLTQTGKNLFVKSPDPIGLSVLYKVGKHGALTKVGQFVSAMGTEVEPNVEYEVDVLLKPVYKFTHVIVPPHERRILEVKGTGTVNIGFFDQLFTVTLLNELGKPVMSFNSDVDTQVPVGFYKVKAASPPFAEGTIDDIMVAPGGRYEEAIKGFGALLVKVQPGDDRGPGPFGFYVFDDIKKVDIGSYLTDMPLVLPKGRYTLKSAGNSLLRNVYPGMKSTRVIPLPPAGHSVSFTKQEKDEKPVKGPKMLDEEPEPAPTTPSENAPSVK